MLIFVLCVCYVVHVDLIWFSVHLEKKKKWEINWTSIYFRVLFFGFSFFVQYFRTMKLRVRSAFAHSSLYTWSVQFLSTRFTASGDHKKTREAQHFIRILFVFDSTFFFLCNVLSNYKLFSLHFNWYSFFFFFCFYFIVSSHLFSSVIFLRIFVCCCYNNFGFDPYFLYHWKFSYDVHLSKRYYAGTDAAAAVVVVVVGATTCFSLLLWHR